MTIYIKNSNIWKEVNIPYIRSLGVWETPLKVYIKNSGIWKLVWPTASSIGDQGIFGGGSIGSDVNTIDYLNISTIGNAVDFGDLTLARYSLESTSNSTNNRGVFAGGWAGSIYVNIIDYMTISASENATDFGDLTSPRQYPSAASNGTNNRGIFSGGNSTGPLNIIDYITISSIGNASDFGDLTVARYASGATSNGTNERGVFGGGYSDALIYVNNIDYVNISSTSNAVDFGDLSIARYNSDATSNGTNDRGIFGGGWIHLSTIYNIIEYITISTTGNTTDFGDLSITRHTPGATSNNTGDRGIFGGGNTSTIDINVIDYITISSIGDTTDFGDLTLSRSGLAATSNS